MITKHKNEVEQFSFDFKKLLFCSTNPGKQTTKNLIILLIFFVVVVALLMGGAYLLNIKAETLIKPLIGLKGFSYISKVIKPKANNQQPP